MLGILVLLHHALALHQQSNAAEWTAACCPAQAQTQCKAAARDQAHLVQLAMARQRQQHLLTMLSGTAPRVAAGEPQLHACPGRVLAPSPVLHAAADGS